MASLAGRELTGRQRAVIERIDKRQPIKLIAAELGVSETRINQHIRALKDIYGATSLTDLVEAYRAENPEGEAGGDDQAVSPAWRAASPYRNSACAFSQVETSSRDAPSGDWVDPGEIVLADAHHVLIDAPWHGIPEPVVVPAALDGKHAVLLRLAVMIGIAFGVIALVILVITASLSLSTMLDGKAEIRMDAQGRSLGAGGHTI